MGEPIHIALTFDDGFWAPAYATMRSVCLASGERDSLVLHPIHWGLGPGHRRLIDTLADEFPVAIRHLDLGSRADYAALVEKLPVRFGYSAVIYARLLLDRLLADVERVVYLDSDLLVRSPIEDIARLDLGENAIAAVMDPHRHRAMLGRDFRRNADLFDFRQPYFNSGVLVIDRRRYAAARLDELMQRLAASGAMDRIQFDQAALNLAFRDNWLPLDFRWNLINPQPAHENFEPHIVHYTGPRKPWHLLSRVAFAQAYRHTMTNEVFYAFWRERQGRRLKRLVGRR
jgi:lipopolysaccharide biosynthesis glycosyltransferase